MKLLLLFLALFTTNAWAIDINGPLNKAGLENKTSDPTTTLTGRVYWNTTTAKARLWNGTTWQDFGSGGGASAAYTITPTAVTAVGTAGMPQAGHVLDSNDFGSLTTAQYSFFNLSANSADGNTTNAKNLTNNATITYTGVGITGTSNTAAVLNGTTQYFNSTDTFFNPGNGKSWAEGCWFAATSWQPGVTKIMMGAENSGDAQQLLYIGSDSSINVVATNTAGTYDTTVTVASPAYTAASWHHIAAVYDYPNTKLKLYLDGKLVGSGTLANTRAITTPRFEIGARQSPAANFFAGRVQECFFHNSGVGTTALTDDDIRKLYSRRFDHSLAIGAESQLWMFDWKRSDSYVAVQDTAGWLVSKDNNRAWIDFSGAATGAYVAAKMLNTQSSLTSVPQGSYDSGYLSSAASSTIPHGLGDVPAAVVVYYETTTNRFTPLMGSNFCETDSTNLYCDWTGLTVAAGSRMRIQAWSTGSMSAITAASASQSGVVNTTTQTLAGVKTFQDGAVIKGVATNSSAATGYVGEIVECSTSSNPPASATWWDVCLMTLSAGDWDVVGSATFRANGATFTSTDLDVAAGGTSGTTVTGVSIPYSQWLLQAAVPNSFAYASIPIGPIKVRSDGSLIYIGPNSYSGQILYIKGNMGVYTSGTPAIYVYVRARRVR